MDHRIKLAITHIEEHPEKHFSLHALAAIAHLSPTYFHRLFKNETGYTPRQFVEQVKLKLAYSYLFTDEIPIQDIAIKLGYNDYETFSRVYKRHFKVSPGDLRLIIQEIRATLSVDVNPIMAHANNEEELLNKLNEKTVSISGIEDVKAFVVSTNGRSDKNKPRNIADKYSISYDAELSKKLYKKTDS